MGNRNMQYMQLFSAHKKLEDRFENARQAYEELNIRYSTLTYVHRMLPSFYI